MLRLLWLVPLLPLLGATLNGLFGRFYPRRAAGVVACASAGLSLLVSVLVFLAFLGLPEGARVIRQTLYTWIASGGFEGKVSLLLDPLSAVMILVVSGVGFIIHLYSVGYMGKDPGYSRYFSFLNLFLFSMLLLVLADNFLLLFVGWEAVGLCSYLLIGFWYEKKSAADAGRKAFIVNRVGDFGFALGVLLIFTTFGTLDYESVFSQAPGRLSAAGGTATAISLLLFLGATGKSAQLPLHTWLPDAMEGPTPVSALIHAATMVTAGVYLVARAHVLFLLSPAALWVVAALGAGTALFAASIGLVQNDIKRVLAYSTISQLGYMFLALGVGAFSAAIFHLMTQAFIKALLFLGAGSVIHALAGEQDLRKMGGLKRPMPTTYLTFLVGALAISGVFPFAGFFSKDAVLWGAWTEGLPLLWGVGAGTAALTSFYMFRLVFMAFHGTSRAVGAAAPRPHESPRIMTGPLVVLALLSVGGGWVGLPLVKGGDAFGAFLAPVFRGGPAAAHPGGVGLEVLLMLASLVLALSGIFLAYRMYLSRPLLAREMAERFRAIYTVLLNKYYVDELYDLALVRPLRRLSVGMWQGLDIAVVDGMVNGAGELVRRGGLLFRRLQTGYVKTYALSMLVGVLGIIAYYTWR